MIYTSNYTKDEIDEGVGLGLASVNKEDKMAVVAVISGTTALNAVLNKYYRFDSNVGTLAITLPSMSNVTELKSIVFSFTTGTTPAVTISAADSKDVCYQDDFEIEAGNTYEINALFNGAAWIVAAVQINVV